jgi:hydrogenase maturation protein HypF
VNALGRRIEIRGIVQGVGFRPWVYRLAVERGLTGRVRNDASGVTIDAFGSEAELDGFAERLLDRPPPAAEIRALCSHPIPVESLDTFSIAASVESIDRRTSIPPDLATCPECLAEISNPTNRRYRYAFTNCTHCGPRFTIVKEIPYDRRRTTMAPFRMCASCQREFDDPADRRFHAQPNACPICGPRLTLLRCDGTVIEAADPIDAAAAAIVDGEIVAVKGIGGFHLSCDATDPEVVARLRRRKRRDEKPFAVMVADLAAAERLAALSPADRALLQSAARPIVLVTPAPGTVLAANVAPDAPLVGIMLPYTPLHHLLLNAVRRPLVMTSGNLSDEPLAYRNDDALLRLAPLADRLLVHDRDIESFCDDSVARVVNGSPMVLRRGRGYVPGPLPVSPAFSAPVLACGALLKNAVCVGIGDSAHVGPHIGDLSNLAAHDAFVGAIERLQRFLRVAPEIVAHDLHPDYLSTRYALSRPEPVKIGVQHHHAHIASVMAEHGLAGPVIGVAYDGTGYGTDGTSWGGEIMRASLVGFDRVATLRPVRLAGGDAAILEPWRVALALVYDAFDGNVPSSVRCRFVEVRQSQIDGVSQLLKHSDHAPLAHGAGRYFDGVAALVLGRPWSRFEAQLALAWNGVADPDDADVYPFAIDQASAPWTLDLRPTIRNIVADLEARTPAGRISARFHNTLSEATAVAIEAAAEVYGSLPVALSGGCFQNPRLAAGVAARLERRFAVYFNRSVPPGDGGVALGQAVVASAIAKGM